MWLFIIATQLLALITSALLWWLIQPKSPAKTLALITIVFAINNLALFYGLTEFWRERFHIYLVVSILQGFMVYAAIITAFIGVTYTKLLKQPSRPKLLRILAASVYVGIVGLSVFNAYAPVVKHLTVTTAKPMKKPLNMVLISDTHLGRWFGNPQLDKLASLVEAQQPDAVVIAGDIMNDSTFYYDKNSMQEQLSKLQAPLGVYAVLGNHDYSGNQLAITTAVEKAGIKVLDNENVLLEDSVWLIGRSDVTDPAPRISAKDLVAQVDTDKPVIFLEHSLESMDELKQAPIDVHLSGHTHGGQIFPLTTLMQWFHPLIQGAKQIGNTQFLVTSGYGFGAVPFRLGTRSEIWVITLQSVTEQSATK